MYLLIIILTWWAYSRLYLHHHTITITAIIKYDSESTTFGLGRRRQRYNIVDRLSGEKRCYNIACGRFGVSFTVGTSGKRRGRTGRKTVEKTERPNGANGRATTAAAATAIISVRTAVVNKDPSGVQSTRVCLCVCVRLAAAPVVASASAGDGSAPVEGGKRPQIKLRGNRRRSHHRHSLASKTVRTVFRWIGSEAAAASVSGDADRPPPKPVYWCVHSAADARRRPSRQTAHFNNK